MSRSVTTFAVSFAGLLLAGVWSPLALAGAPDWSRVPVKQIPLFYPGPAGVEWVLDPVQHRSCRRCAFHSEDAVGAAPGHRGGDRR